MCCRHSMIVTLQGWIRWLHIWLAVQPSHRLLWNPLSPAPSSAATHTGALELFHQLCILLSQLVPQQAQLCVLGLQLLLQLLCTEGGGTVPDSSHAIVRTAASASRIADLTKESAAAGDLGPPEKHCVLHSLHGRQVSLLPLFMEKEAPESMRGQAAGAREAFLTCVRNPSTYLCFSRSASLLRSS